MLPAKMSRIWAVDRFETGLSLLTIMAMPSMAISYVFKPLAISAAVSSLEDMPTLAVPSMTELMPAVEPTCDTSTLVLPLFFSSNVLASSSAYGPTDVDPMTWIVPDSDAEPDGFGVVVGPVQPGASMPKHTRINDNSVIANFLLNMCLFTAPTCINLNY
jgi:hypothetical protein